eukprot:Lithocolla_globosa_v1_NODE_10165_length_629_cov_6.815331.p2 type:complete len:116 gc:universal NODE_10165_length_629_cov_6.815331:141-488(+)
MNVFFTLCKFTDVLVQLLPSLNVGFTFKPRLRHAHQYNLGAKFRSFKPCKHTQGLEIFHDVQGILIHPDVIRPSQQQYQVVRCSVCLQPRQKLTGGFSRTSIDDHFPAKILYQFL